MVHFRFFTAAALLPALAFLSACALSSPAGPQFSQSVPSASARASLLGTRGFPVANHVGKSVLFYAARGNGNIVPLASISGDITGLTGPAFLARDPADRLYVTDLSSNSVRVFAEGADGNVAPIQIISGPRTGLLEPYGIAFHGDLIFVGSHPRAGAASRICVFGAGSDGDVAPIRTITGSNTGLNNTRGVAVDASGYIYAANRGTNTITVYAPDEDGDVAPIRTISGSNTQLASGNGIALDSAGRIYVTASPAGKPAKVLVFAAGADGNVKPAQVISGAKTRLDDPAGIAVNASEIYVADYSSNRNSISVFRAGANGDVAPLRSIAGDKTQLKSPLGILIP
jgi:sugar lactone lactonase YvrE